MKNFSNLRTQNQRQPSGLFQLSIMMKRFNALTVFFLFGLSWCVASYSTIGNKICGELMHSVNDDELITLSQTNAQKILEARSHTLRVRDLSPKTDKVRLEYNGVPTFVESIDPSGKVFRYYAGSAQDLERIEKSGRLLAGPTPYVIQSGHHYKVSYPMLTGVFATLPNAKPVDVGVFGNGGWVEFEFPKGVSVLRMQEANIFLVPGKPSEFAVPIKILRSSRLK